MLKQKPYFLFLFSALLLLILGFLIPSESKLDFNIHDTYYVMAHRHLCWLFTEILAMIFLIYSVLDRVKAQIIPLLSKIHVYGTLLSIIALFFPYSAVFGIFSKPSRFPLYDDMQTANGCVSLSGLVFLFFQLLFIINIFVAIIKKLRLLRASQ